MANVAWTDGIGPATLSNAFIFPGNRFANWSPNNRPFGVRSNTLATGALNVTAFRDDLTVGLDIPGIPNTDMAKMLRLQMHLKRGGTVTLDQAPDIPIPLFGDCKLAPGADVSIQLTDKATLEYTLSTVLRGGAGSYPEGTPDGTTDWILWLQADKPLWPSLEWPDDGTLLDQQNDTSGNGNHGVAATEDAKPRFDLNIQNGLPGIYFSADNEGDPSYSKVDRLIFPWDALKDLPEGEVFAVVKLVDDTPRVTPGVWSPSDDNLRSSLWQLHRDSDSFGRSTYRSPIDSRVRVAFGGVPMDVGIVPLDLSKAHVLNAVASPTERTVRFNSVERHTEDGTDFTGFPASASDAEAQPTLGADADGSGSLHGWVLEFVFVYPVRTPTQRAAWHTYLANKWDVELVVRPAISTLVVGGGAAGGWGPEAGGRAGGGGGAGGYVYKEVHLIEPGSYPVVVGAGGASGTGTADNGGDSTFDTITAKGGGHGAVEGGDVDVSGAAGGSGGGSIRSAPGGGVLHGSVGGAVEPLLPPENSFPVGWPAGNVGGNGHVFSGSSGSGGGAGSFGTSAGFSPSNGVIGGAGAACSISGASVKYAGGGGSGGYGGDPGGAGSDAGGGAGGGGFTTLEGYAPPDNSLGVDGDYYIDFTVEIGLYGPKAGGVWPSPRHQGSGQHASGIGCGGGGAYGGASVSPRNGGSGSKGIVIIRYKTSDFGTCTGGTKTTDGADTVHTFTSNGTFLLVAA